MCFDQVEAFEREKNVEYDFVAKFSANIALLDGLPNANELDAHSIHVSKYDSVALDETHFVLAPRHAAATLFAEPVRLALCCDGDAAAAREPERALSAVLVRHFGGKLQKHDWPFVRVHAVEGVACERLAASPARHAACAYYSMSQPRHTHQEGINEIYAVMQRGAAAGKHPILESILRAEHIADAANEQHWSEGQDDAF